MSEERENKINGELNQARKYRKMARKLALKVNLYCTHENQEKYGSIYYLAENIAPLVEKVLKETK